MNPFPTSTWRVFKFGGASVKDANAVRNAVSLVERYGGAPLVVVVSAMAKTTNALETVVQALAQGQLETAKERLAPVVNFHREVVEQLGLAGTELPNLLETHWNSLLRMQPAPYAVAYDAVVSGGEWASAQIVAAALAHQGLPARWVDAGENVITSNDHRRASVDFAATSARLATWQPAGIAVTQGFVGATADGIPTTLGREGSDYTAAVLAHCLNAAEVTIWKDVPGVLSGDPRHFPNPVQLHEIPYREAIELAYYGASVIHPKTIQPLQAKGIVLRVRSFVDPELPSTRVGGSDHLDPKVPCFIRKANQVLVSVASRDLRFLAERDLSALYGLFHAHGAEVNAVQHGATQTSFALTHDPVLFSELLNALQADYRVVYNEDLVLYTVRHPSDEAVDWVRSQGERLLEQSTRTTFQALVRV